MSIETASSYLAEIGQQTGVDLSFGDNGTCAIDFGERGEHTLAFHFVEGEDLLLVLSPLAEVPRGQEAAFHRAVLRLNVQCLTRFGGVLGLDGGEETVLFAGAFPLEGSTYAAFEAFLQPFINAIDELKTFLGNEDFVEGNAGFSSEEEIHLYGLRV